MLKSSMRIALPALMMASLIPIIAAHAKKAEPPFVAKKGIESEASTAESRPLNPLDPAAMLLMGSQANDLDGPNVRPWHVKVSYQTFDSDGDPDKSGTFEEFWASPKKYKRIYTGDDFNQIDVATDQGLFRNGSQEWPVELERRVRDSIVHPVPENVEGYVLSTSERSLKKAKLQCVTLRLNHGNLPLHVMGYSDTDAYPHYCFDQGDQALRISSQGGGIFDAAYENTIVFQGRHVARDVRITFLKKRRVDLHVETIEGLDPAKESAFDVPPNALGPMKGIIEAKGEMQDHLLKWVPPVYTEADRQNHINGKVTVKATIGKDGNVIASAGVSGPPPLQKSAADCVHQWEFRPFVFLGEPAEVEDEFVIEFAFN